MKVFVTGATGFIGSALVDELIGAGHKVRGLTRSKAGAAQLRAAGAEPHDGSLEDLESLRVGAKSMDAVAHLAFGLDMSKFAENAGVEVEAINALASSLEPGKLLIVTSGVAITAGGPNHLRKETDPAAYAPELPRRSEATAQAQAANGLHIGVVRMSQIHDTHKQGLVTFLVQIAREKGVSAYVGDGANRWAAAPLKDTARLYRLALEKNAPNATYHAVAEEGVALKEIAEAIGKGLNVPVVSLAPEDAIEHFGMFAHFAGLDIQASSDWTQHALAWKPTGPGLIEDLSILRA